MNRFLMLKTKVDAIGLAILMFILGIIFAPIIGFFMGWLFGLVVKFLFGKIVIMTINSIFITSFSVDIIPPVFAVLGLISEFFHLWKGSSKK